MSDELDTDSPPPTWRALAALLRGPFGFYQGGEAVSMIGTWMQAFAQGWVMTGLTTQAFDLGLLQAVASLPMLALTMYGGTVADRHDKRLILVITQVVQIILAVVIGCLVLTHRVHIWHLLAASVLLGVSGSFEMPAASALVPEIVGKENIAAALSVDRAIFHGSRLLGPALAGAAIGVFGLASAFFANAMSFLPLIAALCYLHPRAVGTAEEEEQRGSGMAAGWRFVRGDRPTLAMLGLMSGCALCVFPFMAVMMPLYSRDVLHLDAGRAGWLMSVTGVGSLLAAVGLVRVPRSRRVAFMTAAAVMIVLALGGLASAQGFWSAAGAMVILAVGTSLTFGLANTTVQERAPGPLRGRVSALASLSFVGVIPFAALLMGKVADLTSIRVAMLGGAAIYAVVAAYIFTGPARRCAELPAAAVGAVPVEA